MQPPVLQLWVIAAIVHHHQSCRSCYQSYHQSSSFSCHPRQNPLDPSCYVDFHLLCCPFRCLWCCCSSCNLERKRQWESEVVHDLLLLDVIPLSLRLEIAFSWLFCSYPLSSCLLQLYPSTDPIALSQTFNTRTWLCGRFRIWVNVDLCIYLYLF